MNLKNLFKRKKPKTTKELEKGAMNVYTPKVPTKKQVIKSKNASNPTYKNKMQK